MKQTEKRWAAAVAALAGALPIGLGCSGSGEPPDDEEHADRVQQALVGASCTSNSYCASDEYCANYKCQKLSCTCPTSASNHTCVYTGCSSCPVGTRWDGMACVPTTPTLGGYTCWNVPPYCCFPGCAP
jgi:hypothetical protein